ncbi:MAG: bifunctional 3-deoxy-7-phosphoheptulonate synthase/chorismate mutase type II [Bacteroidales bacterium]
MNQSKPLIISGPCSAESRKQVLSTAEALSKKGIKLFRAGIWKPRTKPGNFEGVGEKGIKWLEEVQEKYGIKAATEVANPEHISAILNSSINIIWIGARTVSDPFSIQTIINTMVTSNNTDVLDTTILIKNPINPDIELWCGAVERFKKAGFTKLYAIHRGFSSIEEKIYRNSPIWQVPLEFKRRFPDIPLLCDPSHIAGKRNLIAPLSQRAMDLNFDGLFIESHIDPDSALSDSAQQITPDQLGIILDNLIVRHNSFDSASAQIKSKIDFSRDEIDDIDMRIFSLLSRRMDITKEIGKLKKLNNIPVFQSKRYSQIMKDASKKANELELNPDFIAKLMRLIHAESVREQK